MDDHAERYRRAIRDAESAGEDAFQRWFNASHDVREAVLRGYRDFALHILTPEVCRRIGTPESQTAPEIGYGGGRLLNSACGYFAHAIGVDIHGESVHVGEFLRSRGKTNFQLLMGGGDDLPVDDGSVDFVYSFIVLQHLPSRAVFEQYVVETARVLRSGGLAQLYYAPVVSIRGWRGRFRMLRSLGDDFVEIASAPVNHISLRVRPTAVRRLARRAELRVIDEGWSWKHVPTGYGSTRGGQRYVTLLKQQAGVTTRP